MGPKKGTDSSLHGILIINSILLGISCKELNRLHNIVNLITGLYTILLSIQTRGVQKGIVGFFSGEGGKEVSGSPVNKEVSRIVMTVVQYLTHK